MFIASPPETAGLSGAAFHITTIVFRVMLPCQGLLLRVPGTLVVFY